MTDTLRRLALPLLGLWAVGVVTLTLGYLTAGDGSASAPPAEPAAEDASIVRGSIQQVSGDQLTIATPSGPVTIRLTNASIIEALRPATTSQLRNGDWLNAGASPHEQTYFTITGLVIIPRELLQ